MREDQHLRAAIGQLKDGRDSGAQARVVGDRAVLHGDVQILADQHGLAAKVAHVVERLEGFRHRIVSCFHPFALSEVEGSHRT